MCNRFVINGIPFENWGELILAYPSTSGILVGYGSGLKEINPETCLCPVDKEKFALENGLEIVEHDGDPMDVMMSGVPDWDSVRGIAPNMTGTLSSEDFVRAQRDEWPEF